MSRVAYWWMRTVLSTPVSAVDCAKIILPRYDAFAQKSERSLTVV